MSKNIVILGAGFGGLQTALQLARGLQQRGLNDRYGIVVVDRHFYHTFTPLLYEIATTSEQSANTPILRSIVTYSLHELLAPDGVHSVVSEVQHVDFKTGEVHLASGKLPFAYLVIALGSEPNWMEIPGLPEHALPLKTFTDAIAIRDRLVALVQKKHHDVKILIGGGGTTGVELAGEIKEWIPELEEELRTECQAQVTILEAGPSILGGLDPRVIQAADRRLRKLGIAVRTNMRITKAGPDSVTLADGSVVSADLLIWTGGVKPASASEAWPMEKEPRGRISVRAALTCHSSSDLKIEPMVYAIGDIACFLDPKTGRPLPLMARPAMMEGRVAALNILSEIEASERGVATPERRVYHPHGYPYIVPVGGKYAVAKVGPFVIRGLLAWVFKGFVEFNYLCSIMSLPPALRIWSRGLRIFIRNDRLG